MPPFFVLYYLTRESVRKKVVFAYRFRLHKIVKGADDMARVQSEYKVESIFIDRLIEMGYEFIPMKNYDDVLANFREQLCNLLSLVADVHDTVGYRLPYW